MGNIKILSQLEVYGKPTSPKHVITKEYLDQFQGISGDVIIKKFNIIGDDITTEYIFEHNFNTKNFIYEIYDKDGRQSVFEVIKLDDNNIKVISDKILGMDNDYDLIIIGVIEKEIPEIDYKVWGVRIDTTNSDPDTCSIYTDDCLIAPPTDFGEKPCLLKDGIVQYYLNPNDFTLKEDGTPADITSGNDGDVMIEIPKMAYYITYAGDDLYVKLTNHPDAKSLDNRFVYYGHTRDVEGDCDKLYVAAYLGYEKDGKLRSLSGILPINSKTITSYRTLAKTNGQGYDLTSFYPWVLIQCMYLVKYRNLNSQIALGRGFVDGNSASTKTGGTNKVGMYFGTTKGDQQVKFAGIEDCWGNVFSRLDGARLDKDLNITTAFKDFNDSGLGYINTGKKAGAYGYFSKVWGISETGFIGKEGSGSETTYYCDHNYNVPGNHLAVGCNWNLGSGSGIFSNHNNSNETFAGAQVSARLMYLKN